jgi:hypothetical protein
MHAGGWQLLAVMGGGVLKTSLKSYLKFVPQIVQTPLQKIGFSEEVFAQFEVRFEVQQIIPQIMPVFFVTEWVVAILRAFSSALLLPIGIWSVTLIGWGWVDLESGKNGSSNLRRLSTTCSVSWHPASYSESESLLLGE